MKIYCSHCNDQLTNKDDIIEVEIGFMHDSCYHRWLASQHKKKMIDYDKAVNKIKKMMKAGV